MFEVGIALIVVAVILMVVGLMTRRSSAAKREAVEAMKVAPERPDLDVASRPRPAVAEFHVRGEEAQVTFDVPLPPDGADEILQELLVNEAVEVVREKRHNLPIDGVTKVVALAGRGGEAVRVGSIDLPERGELPPPALGAPTLHLAHVGYDPIDQQFDRDVHEPPTVATKQRSEDLAPISDEIRIPRAVEIGLRGQGIDPVTMDSGEMVRGLLRLFGYMIEPGPDETSYIATKGGSRTFVREVPHTSGAYPELDEKAMRAFLFEFLERKTDRGMLVSDKYAPFGIYDMEQKEPKIRFITRERLQKFVDSLALS